MDSPPGNGVPGEELWVDAGPFDAGRDPWIRHQANSLPVEIINLSADGRPKGFRKRLMDATPDGRNVRLRRDDQCVDRRNGSESTPAVSKMLGCSVG